MTLNVEDKKALSEIRIGKSRVFLDDAKQNFGEGRFYTSVNRSYYASLSAVRSLLILEGIDSDSHSGAVTMLSLHFVRTKLLPVEVVRDFKTLLSRCTDVDYGDFETVEKDDAEDSYDKAESILAQIDTVRTRLILEM
ncbi:MAG: HEPN domain-containing protein [Spirochaetales bacterium]|jgi:uncharacterized protein (UPF0332 family)|nr:HEPN domain-containing protein [Spirochaetales bacterium]